MRTRAEIDKARDKAVITAALAIKRIADKYRVCPVCLSMATADTLERAVEDGTLWHEPDEYEEADQSIAGVTIQ